MYTLLAGSPPFWHRKQMLMLRMIMNGDYQFGSPEWDDRSDTVKDLISRFLVVDPRQRYTASEALAHPFFQQYDVEEVRHFSPFRKFKVRVLPTHLQCQSKRPLSGRASSEHAASSALVPGTLTQSTPRCSPAGRRALRHKRFCTRITGAHLQGLQKHFGVWERGATFKSSLEKCGLAVRLGTRSSLLYC
uniref:Protein kinase domain-containing protein n=1 Tax=Anas platyrhynchos platyrhynchos TaxID=8840 RepID=A0A493TR51_ANAPP